MPARLLTTPEVLDYLNIDKAELIRLIKRENLPFIRIGNQARFRPDQLEPWLENRNSARDNPAANAAFVERDLSSKIFASSSDPSALTDPGALSGTPVLSQDLCLENSPVCPVSNQSSATEPLAITEPFLIQQQGQNLMLRIFVRKAAESHKERMAELVRTLFPEFQAESLVSQALDTPGTPVKLGPIPDMLSRPINIIVTRDKLNAYLFINSDLLMTQSPTSINVLSELDAIGILNASLRVIQSASHPDAPGRMMLLAEGVAPRTAGSSELVIHFKTPRDFNPKHLERTEFSCGSSDNIQPCHRDQLLAEVVKPPLARNGQDIYGKTITCDKSSGKQLKAGPNTYFSTDQARIHARCDGIPYLKNGSVCVDNALLLQKVNYDTGNIQAKGRVIIQEDIESGFSIITTGKIVVKGQIDAATLKSAKSSISVNKGIHGNGKAILTAGTNISSTFATGCRMYAGMNVIIDSSLVRCTVRAYKNIHIKGDSSKVTASTLVAGQSISVGSAGSRNQVKTSLSILIPADDNSESERLVLENNISIVRKQILQQKSRIMRLREQKSTGVDSERRRLVQMEKLLSQHERAYETFRQWLRNSDLFHIEVRNTVWPGVTIMIEDRELKIKKPMKAQRFYYSNSGIKYKSI